MNLSLAATGKTTQVCCMPLTRQNHDNTTNKEINLGDSYTAGIGSNGLPDYLDDMSVATTRSGVPSSIGTYYLSTIFYRSRLHSVHVLAQRWTSYLRSMTHQSSICAFWLWSSSRKEIRIHICQLQKPENLRLQ
jgi:hypothetical protein